MVGLRRCKLPITPFLDNCRLADKPPGIVLAFSNKGLIYGLSVLSMGCAFIAMLGRNSGNATQTSESLPKCVALVVDKPQCDISGCSRRLISHSIGSCFNSRSTWNERARQSHARCLGVSNEVSSDWGPVGVSELPTRGFWSM